MRSVPAGSGSRMRRCTRSLLSCGLSGSEFRHEGALALRRPRVGDGGDPVLLDVDGDRVARHLVGRVPAWTDRHVERPRIEDRMRAVPADRVAELDGGARPVALVAGGVRAVVEHAVLHVDEAREDEFGEHLAPMSGLFHEAEEHPV